MNEYSHEEFGSPSRPFKAIDALVLGLDFVRGVVTAVSNSLELAQTLAAAHANHLSEQDEFRQNAAIEIESLTRGDING